jgi:hypothetical protein
MGKNLCLLIVVVLLITFPSGILSQIIENPAKPKAAGAGRVVVPKEVLAISDQGTREYFFEVPRDLTIAPDGSLIVLDKNQVLQFDRAGKFLRNLYKQGQGPGEMSYVRVCLATDKNIIVHTESPSRLIFFDHAGRYQKEIPVRVLDGMTYRPKTLLANGAMFYIQSADMPRVQGDPDYVDVPHTILALDATTGGTRELSSFSTRSYVVTAGNSTGLREISSFLAAPFKTKYLALSHTSEYLIKIYDPAQDKIVREFRRAYERVRSEPPTAIDLKGHLIGGKRYRFPGQKFQNDVKTILTRGNEIWAVTSTKDDSKGVLIDIFDERGVYQDCFYLKLPRSALYSMGFPQYCALDGGSLWVVERDDDDLCTIRKYRLAI